MGSPSGWIGGMIRNGAATGTDNSRQSTLIWDSIGGAMTGLELYVGQVLDDMYHLEKLLGQGGMGAVFLATHLGTERYVALKLIAPQFMRNEEFVERFKREARAAGRLRHPNVVDVTDFGFASVKNGQVAYLVMEYLDGCTLGDVLSEEKRLPLEWVVDILEQVCSAVHEAHQQGIVHRDLKPDNIWLEPNRLGGYRVKVLDFGIAKLAEVNVPVAGDDNSHEPVSAETLNAHAAVATAAALETATLLQPSVHADESLFAEENETKLFAAQTAHRKPAQPTKAFVPRSDPADEDGTLLFEQGTHLAGSHTAHIETAPQG